MVRNRQAYMRRVKGEWLAVYIGLSGPTKSYARSPAADLSQSIQSMPNEVRPVSLGSIEAVPAFIFVAPELCHGMGTEMICN
jgi:hypothetical protein